MERSITIVELYRIYLDWDCCDIISWSEFMEYYRVNDVDIVNDEGICNEVYLKKKVLL